MTQGENDLTGLDSYMKTIAKHPILSREDEQRLAREVRDTGCPQAVQRLVTSNLRFVVKVALQYKGYRLNILDLVQEGNIGLMIATRKFDPDRGLRLVSYAVWWIRAYIQSYTMRSWSLVKVGTTQAQRKLFFKLRSERARADHAAGPGERGSVAGIAETLNVTQEDVNMMESRLHDRDSSLDKKISNDSSSTPMEFLRTNETPMDHVYAHKSDLGALRSILKDNTAELNERERDVLGRRLLSDEPETLSALGHRMHVSRERVRQIETRAIGKLRQAMHHRAAAA